MNIIITLIVVALVAYGMLKQYNPQAVLISAGIALFLGAFYFNGVAPVEAADAKGLLLVDIWERFTIVTNGRLASTGLLLVAIAGVSTYLNKIGASAALIRMTSAMVMRVSNPYILLYVVLVVVSILYVFITGATSLSLLLMGTLYPLLRNAGISAKTLAATIIIPTAWEYGPGQVNAVIGAEAIKIGVMDFVIQHQTPLQVIVVLAIALLNIFWQRHLDNKEGFDPSVDRGSYLHTLESDAATQEEAPGYYALLPLLPFVFLIGFSELFTTVIKMTIPTAMMLTITVCMLIEMIRYRSVKQAFSNFSAWLEGTGMIFASVITLMVAAEFFAKGLEGIGAIKALIGMAESFAMPPVGLSLMFCVFILLTAFITGSGNAPVMAFVTIVPTVSAQFNINPLLMLVPILMAAGIGRSCSPVAGVIITVAGMAKLTPLQVVTRTAVPVLASLLITIIYSVVRYS